MTNRSLAIRILIVDDDEDDFLIISDYIKGITDYQFQIDWCFRYDEAVNHIFSSSHDLYFIDYMLGEKTGLELIQEVKLKNSEEPVILLTGIDSRDLGIQAMRNGALDYLEKSELNTEKLERCIRFSLERSIYIKALKANERKFHGIFEKSKDPIFLADENLMFKEVNSATSELFRFSREELGEISLCDLFANEQAKSAFKTQLEQLGVAENKEVEMLTKLKDKKSCILSVSREINPLGDWYVQGVIRDITHLKKIEKANLQIEKLQSTDRILRTLAHEVRNPLTNLYLSLDQLKPEKAEQESMIYYDIFERNLRRIDILISELLDSARPFEISIEKTTLQAIIDKTVAVSADRVSLKDISLHLDYPDQPAYIMGDESKLKIAFLNIIINAIEAVQPHSGQLTISLSDEDLHYKVSIEDNGIGISEENLSRIFDPYFTSKPNGFGLGLASALNIIRSHKASLDVQSTEGIGTTFILLFDKA